MVMIAALIVARKRFCRFDCHAASKRKSFLRRVFAASQAQAALLLAVDLQCLDHRCPSARDTHHLGRRREPGHRLHAGAQRPGERPGEPPARDELFMLAKTGQSFERLDRFRRCRCPPVTSDRLQPSNAAVHAPVSTQRPPARADSFRGASRKPFMLFENSMRWRYRSCPVFKIQLYARQKK